MESYEMNPGENDGMNFDGGWNTDDEYKPTPLVPEGTYFGAVSKVTFDPKQQAIIWEVPLSGNPEDLFMSDGETPINGKVLYYRNWLPKPADANILTKSGSMTKRQAKINMLKEFADLMQIDMSTPEAVKNALVGGEWIGLSVKVNVSLKTYEGRISNEIKKMVRNQFEGDQVNGDDEIPF